MYVMITRVDEAKNNLILSERHAWEKVHLQEGALLEGTVTKLYPYGAQVKIGNSNRAIAELESEPALFISNKARVFAEVEEMARKYREKLPANSSTNDRQPPLISSLSFDDEASLFANWRWFKFQRDTAD